MSLPIAEIAAAPRAELAGIELPARFTGLAEECAALRERAGVFDASLRRWVRMRGEDRVAFLQGMVSNDVKVLAAGDTAYVALLTQQGRVVSDLRVYAAEDHFILDLPAQAAAAAQAALERYIVADDVELEADDGLLIGLEGPAIPALLAAVAAGPTPARFGHASICGCDVRFAPASHAGEGGVVIAVAAADVAAVWHALRDAGAGAVGLNALDVLRVEAGIPWMGIDMDDDVLVMEADLENAISFKKGCYLGQEVVERVSARGHVNRKRTGLAFDGAPVLARTPLLAADKEVGWVTSSVASPRLARTIGMGYVRREHLVPGTVLDVSGGGRATVAALPFVKGSA